MTVAASVTVAQLNMLKGPTLKKEVSECNTKIKKKKKKRKAELVEGTNERKIMQEEEF